MFGDVRKPLHGTERARGASRRSVDAIEENALLGAREKPFLSKQIPRVPCRGDRDRFLGGDRAASLYHVGGIAAAPRRRFFDVALQQSRSDQLVGASPSYDPHVYGRRCGGACGDDGACPDSGRRSSRFGGRDFGRHGGQRSHGCAICLGTFGRGRHSPQHGI